jgi:hypothetical protein
MTLFFRSEWTKRRDHSSIAARGMQHDAEELPFVAPERSVRPRAPWRAPYDFFWAVLCQWNCERLAQFMLALHVHVTQLPRDERLYDTRFWDTHWLPVLLPRPAFKPHMQAFEELGRAALDARHVPAERAHIVASMRLCAFIAFVVDCRVRILVMVNDARTHGRMNTRPPDRFDVWEFLRRGGGARARDYVDEVGRILHDQQSGSLWSQEAREERVCALTHERVAEITCLWVEDPPLPRPTQPATPVNDEKEADVFLGRLSPSSMSE